MILEHRNRKGVHSSITWAGGVKQATWAGITLVSNLGWRRSQTSCLGRHHASFGPNNMLGWRWAWACFGLRQPGWFPTACRGGKKRRTAESETGRRSQSRSARARHSWTPEGAPPSPPPEKSQLRRHGAGARWWLAQREEPAAARRGRHRPPQDLRECPPGPDRSPPSLPSVVDFVDPELVHG